MTSLVAFMRLSEQFSSSGAAPMPVFQFPPGRHRAGPLAPKAICSTYLGRSAGGRLDRRGPCSESDPPGRR